jgi:hypothetical protein
MLTKTDLRTPVRVRIRPETKECLSALAAAVGMSVAGLLERMVLHWDAATQRRLKPEQHEAYRDGTLTYEEAFGRPPKLRKLGRAVRENLAVDIRLEAFEALQRFESFTGYSRPILLGIIAKQRIRRGPPPGGEPAPQPELAPELAVEMREAAE